jgi:hypothetical protein
LPAATEVETPELIRFWTAVSSVVDAPPPSERLATAGSVRLAVTQSTPEMTVESVPSPLQSSTRTAWSVTPLATP